MSDDVGRGFVKGFVVVAGHEPQEQRHEDRAIIALKNRRRE
jgi:hypothetical protein